MDFNVNLTASRQHDLSGEGTASCAEAEDDGAVGIGSLLAEGIGDTIRVSLTGDPVVEVLSADGKWRRAETARRGEFVEVALQLGFYETGVVRISGR